MEDTKKIVEEVAIRRRETEKSKELLSKRVKNTMLTRKRKKQDMESYYTAQLLLKNNRENQKSYQFYKKQQSINKITNSCFYDKSRENSPIICVRIVGANDRVSKQVKEILSEFKLLKLFSAVILDYNKDVYEKLMIASSYITWGYTNKKTINTLVSKRGVVYENKELKELSNEDIERNLGKHNIICLEDIIYELSSVNSKNRKLVMSYLGFFLLSPCEELKDNSVLPYYKGGCTGFRGDNINSLIGKMI